jgi:hypothetical protein
LDHSLLIADPPAWIGLERSSGGNVRNESKADIRLNVWNGWKADIAPTIHHERSV